MDKRRPIRWRPRARHIAAIAASAFVGLTGLLGVRVAMGDDPALRSASTAKPAPERHTSLVSSVISTATGLLSDDEGDDEGDDDGGSSGSWSGSAPSPSTGTSGG